MLQQSHFITVVRIRNSCSQLFITSVWEYLKALIVHGPNHEVMITANKVLRALSSHCSQSRDMRTLSTSQQWQHHPASPNMLFSEVPDWEQLLFLNKQQQLSWSTSCTQANSLKSLVSLRSDLFLALVKKKYIWPVTGRRSFFPQSSCAFHISLNCISYHQCARAANSCDVNRTLPSRLCVVKELLLLRDLEQRLEWARAASLGETFLLLNRSRGSGGPVIHQINQAPRSISRKRVQSKHCDPENKGALEETVW